MRLMTSSLLALGAAFMLSACTASTSDLSVPEEQVHGANVASVSVGSTPERTTALPEESFHMEERLKHPVEVPSIVLRQLQSGNLNIVDACMDNGRILSECYEAGIADLDRDSFTDFVIVGRGKMLGANVTPFWIVRGSDIPRLILEVAAHDLFIGRKRTKGHYDIDAVSMTATEIITTTFKFNGEKYEAVRTLRESL